MLDNYKSADIMKSELLEEVTTHGRALVSPE
jgi:hypothetical protein